MLEAVYAVGVIAASIVIYFRFIDRPLDKTLDRMFAGWHAELKELDE